MRELKRSMNFGRELLREEDLAYVLDPGHQQRSRATPLVSPTASPKTSISSTRGRCGKKRPPPFQTGFSRSEYGAPHTDLATHGRAPTRRRASGQRIGSRCGFGWKPLRAVALHGPRSSAWRRYDAGRYQAGLPWDASMAQSRPGNRRRVAAPRAGPTSVSMCAFERVAERARAGGSRPAKSANGAGPIEIRRLREFVVRARISKMEEPVSAASEILGPARLSRPIGAGYARFAETLERGVSDRRASNGILGSVRDFRRDRERVCDPPRPSGIPTRFLSPRRRTEDALRLRGLEMAQRVSVPDDIEGGRDLATGRRHNAP